MQKIAIIDDRTDIRERLSKRIAREIQKQGKDWIVENFPPLPKKEDYQNWIVTNKIAVLIVDEKLKEAKLANDLHADYNGHDLVKIVREVNKQMPIYIITAHVDDSALTEMKGEFEDVISRGQLDKGNIEPYIQRFIRATQSYLDNYELEYKRLAELSELVALDKADKNDYNELYALQAKLQIPLSSFISSDRVSWINELEEKTRDLEKLSNEIKKFLEE